MVKVQKNTVFDVLLLLLWLKNVFYRNAAYQAAHSTGV
jgi:hypothetical protein